MPELPSAKRSNVRRSNLTACARCKSRKQRCDQRLPACAACERAGVACVSKDLDGRTLPRSYVRSLEDRIAHLEKCLISHGICDYDEEATTTTATRGSSIKDSSTTVAEDVDRQLLSEASKELLDRSLAKAQPPHPDASASSRSFELPMTVPKDLSSKLIDRILVPYLGQSVTAGDGNIHRTSSNSNNNTDDDNDVGSPVSGNHTNPANYEKILKELPRHEELPMPAKESATKLINAYFEHSDFFSPILCKEQLLMALDRMYQGSAVRSRPHSRDQFQVCVVFAVAVCLLNRVDSSLSLSSSTAYFTTAARLLVTDQESIFGLETIEHLEALLLIIQYQSFESNLRGVWHFIGLATRLAIHLGLHTDSDHQGKLQSSTNACCFEHIPNEPEMTRKRLFWATYTFERNICPVLCRPFSIPDEAIETSLPKVRPGENSEASTRALAIHLIKLRQLESEIYTTLHQKPPYNGACINYNNWRERMQQKLHQWYNETPPCDNIESPLAPVTVFEGFLVTSLVQLYYPSRYLPALSNPDISMLAQYATCSVTTYRDAFRKGALRFYWRAAHNLFRAGSALLYCRRADTEHPSRSLNAVAIQGSIGQCSNILWGMAERWPDGKAYRDAFERLLTAENTSTECSMGTSALFDGAFGNTDWLNAWIWDPVPSPSSVASVQGL